MFWKEVKGAIDEIRTALNMSFFIQSNRLEAKCPVSKQDVSCHITPLASANNITGFVIALGINNYALSEILRFICISGIIISVVLFFSFIDEPIGGNGPVGLVKQPMNSTALSTYQWIINIGGTIAGPADTEPYKTGIQIPIYVVIFGIVGGYLRYLYKTSKLVDKALQAEPREKAFFLLIFIWSHEEDK
jgi:hypothetical protein